MATTTSTEQLHSQIIIKEEQIQFNSDAEEQETNDILYRSTKVEIFDFKSELLNTEDGYCSLNDIKKEEYNNLHVMDVSEKTDKPCIQSIKEEFQNMSENNEINDGFNSELIIKEEDLSNKEGIISIDNEDENVPISRCSSLTNGTTENLTGGEGQLCTSKTNTQTKVILSSTESDTNASINNLNEVQDNVVVIKKILIKKTFFKCDKCNKKFNQSGHLKMHTIIHHTEKTFKCDKCEKSFVLESDLIQHALIHIKEKPFKCDICKITFDLSQHLEEHAKVHTEERPFKCDKCKKSYAKKCVLKRHVRIHDKVETSLYCKICKKNFHSRELFKEHVIMCTHVPFKCDKCEKCYTTHSSLKRHANVHVKEKPFSCTKCKKTFTERYLLKKHAIMHTGVKHFKCDICDKRFTSITRLIRHARITARRCYV